MLCKKKASKIPKKGKAQDSIQLIYHGTKLIGKISKLQIKISKPMYFCLFFNGAAGW